MKASNVKLNDLKTYKDHSEAIESIENDYQNIIGGLSAWNSGYTTYLTATAKQKIKAINARIERLFIDDE